MLVWILSWLSSYWAGPFEANASSPWGTIPLRGMLAAGISLTVALVWGGRLIRWLKPRASNTIRSASPRLDALHKAKQATPTMGGILIVAAIATAVFVFGDLSNPYVQLALWVTFGLAAVGAVDDFVKIHRPQNGLSVRVKLAAKSAVALGPAIYLYRHHQSIPHALDLNLPTGFSDLELGWWFVPWAAFVIVGSSNAVNLTDGLDGLAGGCLVFATAALAVLAYVSGAGLLNDIDVPQFASAGELMVVACGMIGGLIGFLWFNRHPARVFMGDTGSLPLGGLLGFMAVAMRQEILLVIIGGVFVAEAVSVMVQVGYFKWRRRRLLLCAPLHHHFQFKGWSERKIVARFWMAGACCAIVGLLPVTVGNGLGAVPGVGADANASAVVGLPISIGTPVTAFPTGYSWQFTNPKRKRGNDAGLCSRARLGIDAGFSTLALRFRVRRPLDASNAKMPRRRANNRLTIAAREPGESSSGQ